jgi:outer membrane receptor protein involved in Fe transport
MMIAVTMSGAPTVAGADPQAAARSDAADAGGILSEVVVTARKRGEERLQDIPTAISAFNDQMLQDMGVTEFTDFAYQVPGLSFNDTGAGEKRYIMRGVQSAGQEQVAVYFDEVPATGVQSSSGDSGSQTPDLMLVDLERIEVLKGPQGTTFGANSQTGVVRFITHKPVLDAFEADVKIGGEYLQSGDPGASVSGTVNLPLIDGKLGLRTSAYYEKRGGYIDNVRLGNENINSNQTTGGRLMLRYEPTDSATIDAMVWLQNRDIDGANGYHPYDTFHVGGDPNDPAALDRVPTFAFFDTGTFNNGDYVDTARTDEQQIYSLTWTQELSWATLTTAGSLYKRDFGFFRDNTWSIISLNVGPPGATTCFSGPCVRPDLFPELTDQTQNIDQKTVEVRLNSVGDGALGWLVGAFYRDRESDFRSVSPIVDPATGRPYPTTGPSPGFSALPGAGIPGCQPCALARYNTRTIEESAVFGEVTYRLFDTWEVMAGLRQFTAEQDDDGFYVFQFPLFGGLPPPDTRNFKEDRLIKKFQLSYRPSDDVTIFALASEGFRLGGTNQANIAAVPPGYEADSLWNYEVGIKSVWLDRRLIVNSSLFRIDWDNIQVSGRDPSGAFAFIGNAGAAEVLGLELETSYRPINELSISVGGSWLPKRELTEDQVNATVAAPGRKGDELPRIPEFTANVSLQYEWSLGGELTEWSAWLRGDWAYHGESETELRPTATTNRVQEAYDITNLRFGGRNDDKGVDLALYVNNVFNIQGDVFLLAATATPTLKYTNQPRTIGVELSKRF